MEQDQWAPLMRLQEQYRAAHDQGTRDMLDAAMTREVNAIVKGRSVMGTLDTMRDNLRRLDRSRGRLERMATPLMVPANDPWPELDRRIQRDAVVDALKPKTRRTLDLFMRGFTYEEAAELMDEPIGTLKSRVSRAKGGIRHQD